jgi:hypothetical protein
MPYHHTCSEIQFDVKRKESDDAGGRGISCCKATAANANLTPNRWNECRIFDASIGSKVDFTRI